MITDPDPANNSGSDTKQKVRICNYRLAVIKKAQSGSEDPPKIIRIRNTGKTYLTGHNDETLVLTRVSDSHQFHADSDPGL